MAGNSNSISPQPTGAEFDLGADGWSRQRFSFNNDGEVVEGDSLTGAYPLSLLLDGDPCNEIVATGVGHLDLLLAAPYDAEYPITRRTVADGEVIGSQVRAIYGVDGVSRVFVSWGGRL